MPSRTRVSLRSGPARARTASLASISRSLSASVLGAAAAAGAAGAGAGAGNAATDARGSVPRTGAESNKKPPDRPWEGTRQPEPETGTTGTTGTTVAPAETGFERTV